MITVDRSFGEWLHVHVEDLVAYIFIYTMLSCDMPTHVYFINERMFESFETSYLSNMSKASRNM